ncbi:cysteine hydrolase family protein [Modicisalibacter radicis]|uniref:cysteine hydrolase family protein n=1 Tax=Halomonas sp. EAR18 TaxID=2518972 RepID=UPI00109C65CE|nr:cysteine hydrolase family protein [Halomonas sp. EAR18]
MSKRAIIAVDIQNEYFPDGKLPLEDIETAVTNAAKVIEHARSATDLVIHVRHEAADSSRPFFTPGTQGVAIHPMVAPLDSETVLVKHFPNSFLETGLKELLDQQGIEDVVVIGAMSHMCIDATSRAASDFGYKTTIVHDACATRDLEFDGMTVPATQVHAAMMAALAFAYGTVITTDQYIT